MKVLPIFVIVTLFCWGGGILIRRVLAKDQFEAF